MTEEAPAGERGRLRDFTRVAADWSWEVDAELRLIALAGQTPGDQPATLMLGQPLAALGRLIEAPAGDLPVERARREEAPFRDQLLEAPDGSLYRLAGVPLFDESRLYGFRGLAFTSNPKTLAEERFVAGLGVELRLPLDAIIASAEAMIAETDSPLSPTYVDYARDIAGAARHLSALLGDLFDRSPEISDEFLAEAFDLRGAVEQALSMVAMRATGKKQVFETTPGSRVAARADRRRALQILVNLLTNAVKFTPEGGCVRVDVEAVDGRSAVVHVTDTGPGISLEDQERIFERFERVPGTQEEGSGLGLHIARKLARQMGGDLIVKSAPGEGARFSLSLPIA